MLRDRALVVRLRTEPFDRRAVDRPDHLGVFGGRLPDLYAGQFLLAIKTVWVTTVVCLLERSGAPSREEKG